MRARKCWFFAVASSMKRLSPISMIIVDDVIFVCEWEIFALRFQYHVRRSHFVRTIDCISRTMRMWWMQTFMNIFSPCISTIKRYARAHDHGICVTSIKTKFYHFFVPSSIRADIIELLHSLAVVCSRLWPQLVKVKMTLYDFDNCSSRKCFMKFQSK